MASRLARGARTSLFPLLTLGSIATLGLAWPAAAQQIWYEGETLVIGGAAPNDSVTVNMGVLDRLGQGGAYRAPTTMARPGQRITLTSPRQAKATQRRRAPVVIAKPVPAPTEPASTSSVSDSADTSPAAKVAAPAMAAPEPLAPENATPHTQAPVSAANSDAALTPTAALASESREHASTAPAMDAPASVTKPAAIEPAASELSASKPTAAPAVTMQPGKISHAATEPTAAPTPLIPASASELEPVEAGSMPRTLAEITPAPSSMPATPPLPAAAPQKIPAAPAVMAPTQSAAVMPVPQPPATAPTDEGMWRIAFSPEATSLTEPTRDDLKEIAKALSKDRSLRVQVKAYASGAPESDSKARRMSLSRALAVRSYLIEQGVGSTRIDVRAFGNRAEGGPGDRVDLILINR